MPLVRRSSELRGDVLQRPSRRRLLAVPAKRAHRSVSADARRFVGAWTCPSGNSVDVFVRYESGVGFVSLEWDTPPPLWLATDRAYYLETILPDVNRRLAEIQERPVGPAAVVTTPPGFDA